MARQPSRQTEPRAARVSLLISTHALRPLSYRIPARLATKVRVGAAVVAPLSGYSRLGVVVELDDDDDLATEEVRGVVEGLSLGADMVELCRWASGAAAVPLSAVLRAALPSGAKTARYRILRPAPGWPWREGQLVERGRLRSTLGGEGLRAAENAGRVELAPEPSTPRTARWAVAEDATPDLGRAYRQRELLEELRRHRSGCTVRALLRKTGATRGTLGRLVSRGAVRLEERPEPPPIFVARGAATFGQGPFSSGADRIVGGGGAWLWRTPVEEQPAAIAAVARATIEGGEQALILAPEVGVVERLVEEIRRLLPAGCEVAPYHGGLGRGRDAVYEAAKRGALDVLVGTRLAAFVPLAHNGVICVVDEPNGAHRTEPGHKGIPVHVRDLALERGRIEDAGVLLLSPTPSLRLYAKRPRVRELPARPERRWPAVRVVDMRGSGATLSSTLLGECRRGVAEGKRVGVVANRLGYATAVSCTRCGAVRSCPDCDLPLAMHGGAGTLICGRCGLQRRACESCQTCGSDRLSPTGFAAERVREEISGAVGEPVGLLAANERKLERAAVVVGTARRILDGEWDLVVVPDADAHLLGSGIGAAERAFRLLYGAAAAARGRLLVQTRSPEHYALQAALRGDYPAFAAAELARRRALGYPPYAHLAALNFEGPEGTVRHAVKSVLRPALDPGVEMSDPVPLAPPGRSTTWRVLLRSRERSSVARSGTLAARLVAKTRSASGVKVRVDVDPEEV